MPISENLMQLIKALYEKGSRDSGPREIAFLACIFFHIISIQQKRRGRNKETKTDSTWYKNGSNWLKYAEIFNDDVVRRR